jgi:hypothetical protein
VQILLNQIGTLSTPSVLAVVLIIFRLFLLCESSVKFNMYIFILFWKKKSVYVISPEKGKKFSMSMLFVSDVSIIFFDKDKFMSRR